MIVSTKIRVNKKYYNTFNNVNTLNELLNKNEKEHEFAIHCLIKNLEKDEINSFDEKWKKTPLHMAVIVENIEAVWELCERGADSDIRDGKGSTALHYAILTGNVDILRILEKWNKEKSLFCCC